MPNDRPPDLDPFGANDPAWERYEGVSWLRRVAQSHARSRQEYRRPGRDAPAFLLVGAVGLIVIVGAVALVFWLFSLLTD